MENKLKMFVIIIGIIIAGIAFFVLENLFLSSMVFLGTIILWIIFSIKILGPTEMAVLVMFGKPVSFRNSGITFIPLLPGCYLDRYSKEIFPISLNEITVYSEPGKYKEKEYGRLPIKVKPELYFSFPQDNRLIKIQEARISSSTQGLQNFFEGIIGDAVRLILGRRTWSESTEKAEDKKKEIMEKILEKDTVLTQVGLTEKEIELVLPVLKLPDEIEILFKEPDKERLKKEAAKFRAERKAIETVGVVIQMMATSRGKTVKEIQELIQKDADLRREFLDLSKDLIKIYMAIDGKSFVDIRVKGAQGMEKSFLNLLAAWKRMPGPGGKSSEEKEEKKEKKEEGSLEERMRKAARGFF